MLHRVDVFEAERPVFHSTPLSYTVARQLYNRAIAFMMGVSQYSVKLIRIEDGETICEKSSNQYNGTHRD